MQNLEEEIAKELSTQMQSEIDFQILSDMLVELGWHRVELFRFDNNRHAVDIKLWLEEHAKNAWESRGASFIFQDSVDAVNFTLKWK